MPTHSINHTPMITPTIRVTEKKYPGCYVVPGVYFDKTINCMNSWPTLSLTASWPHVFWQGQTIHFRDGTGPGQSEKSRTVPTSGTVRKDESGSGDWFFYDIELPNRMPISSTLATISYISVTEGVVSDIEVIRDIDIDYVHRIEAPIAATQKFVDNKCIVTCAVIFAQPRQQSF